MRSIIHTLQLDKSLCPQAETCVQSCPFGALRINEQGFPEVNLIQCEKGQNFCGLTCMNACPQKAYSA